MHTDFQKPPQVVFIPWLSASPNTWSHLGLNCTRPPFIRDLACHNVIQPPIGWEEHEIGNLTEGIVQNNVAVKMKFDQRFNVPLVEDRTMEHKGSRGASCQEARP